MLNKTIHGPLYSKLIKSIYDSSKKKETEVKQITELKSSEVKMTPRKTKELTGLRDAKGNDEDQINQKAKRCLNFSILDELD